VLSTIVLSVATNSLRIALTGVLYEVWGARVAEGFFHGFSGWFIFMVSLVAVLLVMWILRKLPPQESTGAREKGRAATLEGATLGGAAQEAPASSACEGAVAGARRKGFQSRRESPQFFAAVALLGLTAALSQGIEFRERIPIKRPLGEFPLEIGNWVGSPQKMEQKYVDTLDLSDYAIVEYRNPSGRQVNFYVAYYETQRKGESIHSPDTCLPGSGWDFKEAGAVDLEIPGYETGSVRVKRSLMEKLGQKELAYYWFSQRGRVLTSAYELKFFVFWDALTKQRTDGALVRLITRVYDTEKLDEAEARLEDFARQVVPLLEGFIPGRERDFSR